ncbi:MAG TPA: hypothetical protein VNH38_05555 [Candidatus Dormibacteraeota bacterium]|nr:hypothetical protein [Candidatus Dormibacteraeota bacterium]
MAEEASTAPDGQTLNQGLTDLRQTWEHLAREMASGVPELPGVIEQALAGLTFPDLTEETLIKVTESVVARVADAGFPEEATALFRRMGRAMYELLLLLATQEEIREMGIVRPPPESAKPLAAVPPPAPATATPPPELLPSQAAATAPRTDLRNLDLENHISPPDLRVLHWAEETPAAPGAAAATRPLTPTADSPDLVNRPAAAVTEFEPRDPVRPALVRNGTGPALIPLAKAIDSAVRTIVAAPRAHPAAAPAAEVASPASRPGAMPASPWAAPPTAQVTLPTGHSQQAPPAPPPAQVTLPSGPSRQAPPSPRPLPPQELPAAPSPPQAVPADKPTAQMPPANERSVRSSTPASATPPPTETPPPATETAPRELTEDEASLWGFDPAARATETAEAAPQPARPEPAPPEPAPVLAPAPEEPAAAAQVAPPEPAPKSGWTVRLSPKTSDEREKKLTAREAQLPQLVEEIVAAARAQQDGLSARGNARRALAAARDQLPLTDGADPTSQIQALLEAGQLEEAATLAVQMANTLAGEDAAGVACTVGEGAKQSKHVELAVLCFTTAVICCPPCDHACWQLCNLALDRRDVVMAPVWLEFVARLLRARGADTDSISVYRQLLKLTPRRTDLRELLRTSSLTGILPD